MKVHTYIWRNEFYQFCILWILIVVLNCNNLICLIVTVKALKDIGKTLGKKDWDFSVDPCSSSSWKQGSQNAVTCNCSYQNNTLCHVLSVYTYSSLSLSFFNVPCCPIIMFFILLDVPILLDHIPWTVFCVGQEWVKIVIYRSTLNITLYIRTKFKFQTFHILILNDENFSY
jgi:hypothetical protein